MDKITSFTIDHLKLLPGVYVSRLYRVWRMEKDYPDMQRLRMQENRENRK